MSEDEGVAMYDAFAEEFDAHARDGAFNAYYDRPALLGLLGPVGSLRVLDAGCGSGLYAQELVSRGATVVGIDASSEMLRLARQRCGDAVQFRLQDLASPLTWAADGSFDRVVLALVLHHLADPVPALREFHRVLADDGQLLVSTPHPTAEWLRLGGGYFVDEMVPDTWQGNWHVMVRRAPLEAVLADFSAAGFVLDTLVEPRPAPEMALVHPKVYKKLTRAPGFISFRFVKR